MISFSPNCMTGKPNWLSVLGEWLLMKAWRERWGFLWLVTLISHLLWMVSPNCYCFNPQSSSAEGRVFKCSEYNFLKTQLQPNSDSLNKLWNEHGGEESIVFKVFDSQPRGTGWFYCHCLNAVGVIGQDALAPTSWWQVSERVSGFG